MNVLMVAAEASSSLYALRILQHWQEQGQGQENSIYGVGSRDMEEVGFECLGYAEDMAVVGLTEVLKKYSQIKEVYHRVLKRVDEQRPDVAVLLDYPGFNLRLAKELKSRGIPVVYYIAPQIWAWKKGRVKKVRRYVDEVLCILPFEQEFYERYGVKARFVGHPLVEELERSCVNDSERTLYRQRFFIAGQDQVLGLMPGSRHGELQNNFPLQLEVADRLYRRNPSLKVAILVAPTLLREELFSYLQNFKCPYVIVQDDPFKMLQLVDLVLCKSGTATLNVGLMGLPMVIMYKVNFLTGVIGRFLVSGFIGLVNVIAQKEIVPERIQNRATPDELEGLLQKIIEDKAYSAEMKESLLQLKSQLGGGEGAVRVTAKVAAIIEEYAEKKKGKCL